MLTLIQIVQTVANELGLSAPAVVATATDVQTKQLFALINRDGKQLLKEHEWTALQSYFITNIIVPVQTTGNTTANSPIITNIPSTAALAANLWVCIGNGIPVSARVISVDSATQVTLDMLATATTLATPITFAKDTYSLPTDLDRFINRTQWDRTNRWPLLGPSSPQEDEWHRSGVVTVGPRRHFRQVGLPNNCYRFWPPPGTSGDSPFEFVAEYISKNWVLSSGNVPQSQFMADSDTPIFDDQAMILGCKWRFLRIKGMDWGDAQAEYKDYIDTLRAQDGPKGNLSLVQRRFNPLISPANVQDGFFPGS